MWLLKKLIDGTTKYLISEKKCYSIGRKNCDFVLDEDASISRKHCNIYVAKQSECPFTISTPTGVWLMDEQSKYGTYLKNNNDWLKIKPNENIKLTNGSVIKFGLMENVWSLEYKPIIACASGIPTEQKKNIEIILQSIDGFLKNAWTKECSLVIVNEITLTVKVVLALINGVPIVTPNCIEKVIESVKSQISLPDYENYRPEIKENILDKSLVSLDTKNHRKELFKGKKFVIPTRKQLETLKEVIITAGGSVELLSLIGSQEKFAENNVILIQLPLNTTGLPKELCKTHQKISTYLKSNFGRRIIPESEIAQAIAYSSIEKFCNPQSTCFTLRIGERREIDLGPVIIEETPITTQETKHSQLGVIPSSTTIESELPLDSPVEHELSSCNKQQNSEKFFSERKRAHSPNQVDQEFRKKKSKNTENQKSKDSQFVKNKILEKNNKAEEKSNLNKSNQRKSSFITNYFQKHNKQELEKSQQVVRQSITGFWDCDTTSNNSFKRKIPSDSDDSGESSSRKKTKLPEMNLPKGKAPDLCILTPREVVEVLNPDKNSSDCVAFPPIRKNYFRENDDDEGLTGYFGKDDMDGVNLSIDETNNTIFSLTIISPAYIKKDGSLIDPPSVPVNVKRFKKQKILSSAALEMQDDELSEGEWIEPHSNHFNISLVEKNDF